MTDPFLATILGCAPEAVDAVGQKKLDDEAFTALASGVSLSLVDWLELSPPSRLAFSRGNDRLLGMIAHLDAVSLMRVQMSPPADVARLALDRAREVAP